MVDSGVGVEVVGRIEVSLLCAHCVLWGQAVKQSGSHVLPFPGLCSLEQAVPCLPHDLAECTKLPSYLPPSNSVSKAHFVTCH